MGGIRVEWVDVGSHAPDAPDDRMATWPDDRLGIRRRDFFPVSIDLTIDR